MNDTTTVSKPYAVCNDCGVELPTPEDASQHGQETLRPTGDSVGVTARGHSWRVVNPTPQQLATREIEWIVEKALEDACGEIDHLVERGEITREQATEALRHHSDFADAWEEYQVDEEADGD